MSLRNWFSSCSVVKHSSGNDVFSCINIMGENMRHFVYNSKISMCEYHTCFVVDNLDSGRHNELVCSGSILRFNDDLYYFNPLTPFGIDFNKMLPLPTSTVDYYSKNVQYYFQNDVRSIFADDIIDINCTNNMRTCLTFSNSSICFGNIEETSIIHSTSSLLHGIIIAFFFGALCFVVLRKHIGDYPISFIMAFYIVPLVGCGMIYYGLLLSMWIPYLIGNMLSISIMQFMYYPMHNMHRLIKDKEKNKNKSNY